MTLCQKWLRMMASEGVTSCHRGGDDFKDGGYKMMTTIYDDNYRGGYDYEVS